MVRILPGRIRSNTFACSVTSRRQNLSLKKSPANYLNDYLNIIVGSDKHRCTLTNKMNREAIEETQER